MTSEGDQIMLQIRARYPVILVRSWEEERVLLELRSKVAKVGVWSCTKGLIMGNRKIDDTAEPGQVMAHILGQDSEQGVYVLLDFHKFVGDPVIERLLRDAVRELLEGFMHGFPDFHIEPTRLRHLDDGVLVEGLITGTHDGDWAGIPPTGRPIEVPVLGIFEFDRDRLLCEKVHLDMATVLRQIGVLHPAS